MIACDVLIVGGGVVGIYLARACSEKGLTICVVEKGGDTDSEPNTYPPIKFSTRQNLAAVEARNHVLGGNSRFWGGALVEDDGTLIEALGISAAAAQGVFSEASTKVYEKIGIRRTKRSALSCETTFHAALCEFPVLTGKCRNIWSAAGEELAVMGIHCFLESEMVAVFKNDGSNVALIQDADGVKQNVKFSALVVCAGVVDSIRQLSRFFPHLIHAQRKIGHKLNDHLSLPVISFPWRRTVLLDRLFPPRFEKAVTVGRRLEFELPMSGRKGFVHLQAPFDDVEPYRSLKRLVFVRQRGISLGGMARALFSLAFCGLTTLRIGLGRLFAKRLFYPEGAVVNLMVDIESEAEEDKSISLSDDYILNWQLSAFDIANLREASLIALELVGGEILNSEMLAQLRGKIESDEFSDYVQHNCKEALHLGGGLQDALMPLPGLGLKCRASVEIPTYVVSTAMFPRAGVANPVHTLLVCAELLSQYLACSESKLQN